MRPQCSRLPALKDKNKHRKDCRSMTKVNWERSSGEQVEEYVAALLLLRNPDGNRITPSRGDGGVDVQIPVESGGYEFYQIKRFSTALKGAQKRQIKKSWDTFLDRTAPTCDVASWNLVMPYDPTKENREWLSELTGSAEFQINWIGRTQLDVWAAENPRLFEYYFGDGKSRTEELIEHMTNLIQTTAKPDMAAGSEDERVKAAERGAAATVALLDDVDPFYRYEYEVRQADFDALSHETIGAARAREVFVSIQPIEGTDYFFILHIIARCSESLSFSPIRMSMAITATPGTAEYDELRKFWKFGLPPRNLPVTISGYEGPAGGPCEGIGYIDLFEVPVSRDALPPLEIEIEANDESVGVHVVDVDNVQYGSGMDGDGGYLQLSDKSNVFSLTMLVTSTKELHDLSVERSALGGRKPHDILPALRFLSAVAGGGKMTLRVRGGGAELLKIDVRSPHGMPHTEPHYRGIEFVESLAEIQRHVFGVVLVPSENDLSEHEIRELIQCARLLRGENIVRKWSELSMTVKDPEPLHGTFKNASGEGMLMWQKRLVVRIDDDEIDTGYVLQTVCKSVRIADRSAGSIYRAGDLVRFVPGDDDNMILSAIKI